MPIKPMNAFEPTHGANTVSDKQKTTPWYKDTLFKFFFSEEPQIIELCNAVAETNYQKDTKIEFCKNHPITAGINDLAFVANDELIMVCEHQSTKNPNMPLRMLFYISDVLRNYTVDKGSIYGKELIKLPTPRLIVLYNGKESWKSGTLNLFDAYLDKTTEADLQVRAKLVNIKYENKAPELSRSEFLNGYSYLIQEIERYRESTTQDMAIKMAVNSCINQGILAEFLRKNMKGIVDMYNAEMDRELYEKNLKTEGKAEGIAEGIAMVAVRMMKNGKPLREIIECTALTEKQVRDLAKAYKLEVKE